MTNAMMKKFEQAVREFHNEVGNNILVHGWGFHHYGEDYRIEETKSEFKIFRCCAYDIHDTLIEAIAK